MYAWRRGGSGGGEERVGLGGRESRAKWVRKDVVVGSRNAARDARSHNIDGE